MKSYVVLISVVAALGGLLFGFDTAVISGTINFIQPYFGLTEIGLGWTVSSLLFGCIAGVFLAGKAGDHFGRKKVLMTAALLFLISAIGMKQSFSLSSSHCAPNFFGVKTRNDGLFSFSYQINNRFL